MKDIKKENNMATIIVEIPHRLPPTVWVADSDQDIINVAHSNHGLVYQRWTTADAEITEDLEGLEDLDEILKEYGEAIEVGNSSYTEYFSVNDAETEIEAAKEAIAHDFCSCRF